MTTPFRPSCPAWPRPKPVRSGCLATQPASACTHCLRRLPACNRLSQPAQTKWVTRHVREDAFFLGERQDSEATTGEGSNQSTVWGLRDGQQVRKSKGGARAVSVAGGNARCKGISYKGKAERRRAGGARRRRAEAQRAVRQRHRMLAWTVNEKMLGIVFLLFWGCGASSRRRRGPRRKPRRSAAQQGSWSPGAHAWAGLRCSAAGSLKAGIFMAGSFSRRAPKSGIRRFCSRREGAGLRG